MPKNIGLSAMNRMEILDNCLRHDRWWSKAMLLREVNRYVEAVRDQPVSDSTLRNDLDRILLKAGDNLLIEMRKPNSGLKKQKHFRYADRSFSFFTKPPLNPNDYDKLQQAIDLLSQLEGFEVAEELKEIVSKLQYSYLPAVAPKVVFDHSKNRTGIDLIQQLYEAVRDKLVIAFAYQPFDQHKPLNFTLHPYQLKEFNNRWYVVGLSNTESEILLCALDRFKSHPKARPKIQFTPPEKVAFDAEKYFADVIGPTVHKENPVEDVILRFTAGRAPYIATKPLHRSQQLLKTYANSTVSFSYHLRYNLELLALILGFGPDVEVIKPASLRDNVKKAIEALAALYR